MTAAIYTSNEYLWGLCSAYLRVSGHSVQRLQKDEPAMADVVIVDLPWRSSLPTVDCTLLIIISEKEIPCPPGSWFYRKPVDLDVMMDRILEFMEQ